MTAASWLAELTTAPQPARRCLLNSNSIAGDPNRRDWKSGDRIRSGVRDQGRRHEHQLRRNNAALNLRRPRRTLIHTAGFDLDAGIFRISIGRREHGERFINERLNLPSSPIAAPAQNPDAGFDLPGREAWYEPYDSISG